MRHEAMIPAARFSRDFIREINKELMWDEVDPPTRLKIPWQNPAGTAAGAARPATAVIISVRAGTGGRP